MTLLDTRPTADQKVADTAQLGQEHSFIDIDHEMFSTVIISLLLLQDWSCQFLRNNVHNTA